uniref:Glycoside hydrolase family 31 n=1 Tax=Gastrophysa viridula TaxID=154015 RepID=X2D5K2_GASVI|nr:glycoside hydrolase family 31 [Gastrophysa viridula]
MLWIMKGLLGVICVVISLCEATYSFSHRLGDNIEFDLHPTENGLRFKAKKLIHPRDEEVLSGTLMFGRNVSAMKCTNFLNCEIDDSTFSIEMIDVGLKFTWETKNKSTEFLDCYDLQEGVHWYGGPQRRVQSWPLEKMNISGSDPYVVKKDDNFAVAERYWLNSKGVVIYLKESVPLFVDQNVANEGRVCFGAKLEGPYINRNRNILDYRLVFGDDPKAAHLVAIDKFLGKPSGHPDSKMISEPIWTTWAKFKREISDSVVLGFAQDIKNHGYAGQLEIDDNWEKCYGAQEFDEEKFSDIVNTVEKLKGMGFRVTLWIHPFVNNDCENNSNEGIAEGYFVRDENNNTKAVWWNSDNAHQIDFTNPQAAKWWSARLNNLRNNIKIDSFKFDAGETNYGPQPSVYRSVDQEAIPNILTQSYIQTCAGFGSLIEVRSAWRTQYAPMFIRMIDKDSNWGINNGLRTLVTTLLQMNMNGYTMVLPDMIGGNGYGELPSAELIVRWTQANTFMPAMQFSYLPWDITSQDFDAPSIVQKFVNLHRNYSSVILRAMEKSMKDGSPVNPPIWWIDPTDSEALACDDEFLVGDEILVAPILTEGATTRKVYLPKSTWRDGNNGTLYEGPIIMDYSADITTLPYFLRE